MAREQRNQQPSVSPNMTNEEARAYRAALYKPQNQPTFSPEQKRESFRLFWAQQKRNYPQPKGIQPADMENVLWLHLKAVKLDEPKDFENGLKNFGLKRLGN